jgi:uncharacterized protein YggE
MKIIMKKFFTNTKYAISWGILSLIVLAAAAVIFLITATFAILGFDLDEGYRTITIEGEAEVFAVPDIATFNFTVNEVSEDAVSAQDLAAEKVSAAVDFLKSKGVEDANIKTSSYNSYPKFEWIEAHCVTAPCEPGKRELVGYEVRQTVSVKVRDAKSAGELIAGVTDLGINTVSGVSFTIDDLESLQEEARALAIVDAKAKAKRMAKDLGVRLDDVVSFSEGDDPYYYNDYAYPEVRSLSADSLVGLSKEAELPVGENKITSNVFVTFEID